VSPDPLAARVVSELVRRDGTVATAESLTGGLLAAALTSVPGASAVVRGGVVAYATDLKAALLRVDADLLAARGPVDGDVAQAMAAGVRTLCAASYGVATTGVAGPDPQAEQPVGTVFVAVHGPHGRKHVHLTVTGDRDKIRADTVAAALEVLLEILGAETG
jgi:nicotinamide-nucleotide amidase